MSGTYGVEGRISTWLEEREAGTHFPDRLLAATYEQTRATRQVRSLRPTSVAVLRSWAGLAAASAVVVTVVVAGALGLGVFEQPGPGTPSPTPPGTEAPAPSQVPLQLRRGGEILAFQWRTGPGSPGWDIVAQDPATARTRPLVDTTGIIECATNGQCVNFVKSAWWSPDGNWVAFEVAFDGVDLMPHGPCGPTAGLWVQGLTGGPRQLTTPCASTPGSVDIDELWAWSPAGARLALVRRDGADHRLFLVDPSDGGRSVLVPGGDSPTTLAWSPDGARIAYAIGGDVYVVDVATTQVSLLTSSLDGVDVIRYSPDGTRVLVRDIRYDPYRSRLQVMNADGSEPRLLLEGVDRPDEINWSVTGSHIVYQLSIDNGPAFFDSEVWTIAPDGTGITKVFDSDGCNMGTTQDSLPVWAPDGTRVAYNACQAWVVSNADGTGAAQPIDELLHKQWSGGGLSAWAVLGFR